MTPEDSAELDAAIARLIEHYGGHQVVLAANRKVKRCSICFDFVEGKVHFHQAAMLSTGAEGAEIRWTS